MHSLTKHLKQGNTRLKNENIYLRKIITNLILQNKTLQSDNIKYQKIINNVKSHLKKI